MWQDGRISMPASLGPDNIEEYSSMVVVQVGKVVGEVGEIVAEASLQVLANAAIERGQDAAAVLIDIREAKLSYLGQAIPLFEEPEVHAEHGELRGIVEENRVHAIQASLSQPVRVLAAHGPVGCEVVVNIERGDVALLKKVCGGLLQSQLIRGGHVIEVGVLDQSVQPVVMHGAVCVADDALGVAAGKKVAERAITDGIIQFAEQAPAGAQLVFEIVTQQHYALDNVTQVRLLHIVPAKFDRSGELYPGLSITHVDSRGLAFGLGAGFGVEQVAELRAAAKIPFLFGHQVDSGGVREAALSRASLVTFLGVDAGAIGEPRLHARNQVAEAAAVDQLIIVRPLVFQRIVKVKAGLLGIEKGGADLSAGTEISVGRRAIDFEASRQAIGTAQADATIVWTSATGCDGVLAEGICAPGVAGTELYLRDGVRALALLLRQWNQRRIVLAHIVAHAGAEAPCVGQFVAHVEFHRARRQPLVLGPLIAFEHKAHAGCHRHFEHAAILLGVLERHLSRRGVTGVEMLLVELEATVVAPEEVAEPEAQIGAVGPSF